MNTMALTGEFHFLNFHWVRVLWSDSHMDATSERLKRSGDIRGKVKKLGVLQLVDGRHNSGEGYGCSAPSATILPFHLCSLSHLDQICSVRKLSLCFPCPQSFYSDDSLTPCSSASLSGLLIPTVVAWSLSMNPDVCLTLQPLFLPSLLSGLSKTLETETMSHIITFSVNSCCELF